MINQLLNLMVSLALLGPASGWAEESDELWEMTTIMEVVGMPETTRTHTVCMPKGAAFKPEKSPAQKKCEITDVKVSGNKTEWKMQCSGRDPMNGGGKMKRTDDTMKGEMNMASEKLEMTQEISGKLIGTCQAK